MTLGEQIHRALAAKDLLPREHLLDAGFIDIGFVIAAQRDWGVEVCGPMRKNPQWQAQAGNGFALADFQIDWERQTVTCPQGKSAQPWRTTRNAYGQPKIVVDFNRTRCPPCPCQKQCTRSISHISGLFGGDHDQTDSIWMARA